jgi:predicted nucleotidyltransferase
VRTILERAVARGEIRPDVDLEVAIDVLVGPVIYRLLLGGKDMEGLRRHSDAVFQVALEGLRA